MSVGADVVVAEQVIGFKKGGFVTEDSAIRRVGRFTRERRRALGITNSLHLDAMILAELDSWWMGKTQYLETKQAEWLDTDELPALARALKVTPEYLLYVAGYLDYDPSAHDAQESADEAGSQAKLHSVEHAGTR